MIMNVPLRPSPCIRIIIMTVFLLGLICNPFSPSNRVVLDSLAQSTDRSVISGSPIATVKVGAGNLRAQPDINALVIDKLVAGTRMHLVERRPPWYQVELQDGRRGWVHASILKFDSATQAEPVLQTVRPEVSTPAPHTHYRVNVATARVRNEPNLESEVAFRLRQGDLVRVNGIQQDWFLIKDADGRSGWAHRRLFVPADQRGLDSSASPILVKAVRHVRGSKDSEKILFDLKGFHPPHTFTINGNQPRLVCDFKNAQLGQGVKPRIPVNGSLIKDIRVAYHPRPAAKVRVVLDLLPDRAYEVEQIYFRQEAQFALILNAK